MPFSQDTRRRVLLWSDRHCCLCKKACGVNIEVHHLLPAERGGNDDVNNAIPLCFECHGQVQHYNDRHPRGTKYFADELKARREQVYEEFTRNLVPPIHVAITQHLGGDSRRHLPDVGCNVTHVGHSLPVRARVSLVPKRGGKGFQLRGHHLSGRQLIHLNPGFVLRDHFRLPAGCWASRGELAVQVLLTLVDQYDREHEMLPVHYVYRKRLGDWFLRPY